MNSALSVLFLNDLRLQQRYGIYVAYAFVLLTYIMVLKFLGQHFPDWVVAIIIYTDPVVLGFFFLGALMMLEKSEGTRMALAITPMRVMDYFLSKTITLGALSMAAVIILGLFVHTSLNWPLYLFTTLMISITFTSISFPISLYFKTVTSYMMGAAAVLTPVMLPMFVALFDQVPVWALLYPTITQLRLMLVALGANQASISELVLMLFILMITTGLSILWGSSALNKEFGQK